MNDYPPGTIATFRVPEPAPIHPETAYGYSCDQWPLCEKGRQ